jgi:glycosyltransferase involved in cell wall biosynthesis
VKVLAFTEGPNHVCYRYRLEAFAWALADRGWTLESLPLAPNTFERSPQLREAQAADVVILQRKLLPLWQLHRLRRSARVLLYDFDDALFCRDSYSRKGSASWTRLAHFWATIHAVDGVVAGNGYLAEQASAYVGGEKVHLVPTCVSPDVYPLAKHERSGRRVRLVWIGQHSTLPCLHRADGLLEAATARTPGLELRVICNQFPRLHGIRVVPRQWSQASEAHEIAEADIGVSYLPDDEWSRGKCGLKVLQYMAAGLPVIANPVGMNCEMIEHGRTGFLARTADEWSEAIATLANNPRLRAKMGAAGREVVERQYSVGRWAPQLAQLVERLWHESHGKIPQDARSARDEAIPRFDLGALAPLPESTA